MTNSFAGEKTVGKTQRLSREKNNNNGKIKFPKQNQNNNGALIKYELKISYTLSAVWETSLQNLIAAKH